MYGVPADLDLCFFLGARLIQIALGEGHLQFTFDRNLYVGVEGKWQVLGSAGEIIDDGSREQSNSDRTDYKVHVLLGRTVEAWTVHAPEYFELRFERGMTLRVCDDSEQYESFSIQPGDIFV